MANVLPKDKQIAVIGALAEGSSIRSIERMTGIHRDTIMRLGVRVGQGCELLMDSKMQDLGCRYLQFDEVWGFIGKKERHVSVDDNPDFGDVWTYCAIDAETKLVPAYRCGKRNIATTSAFVQDVASRMRNRVQISTDALRGYAESIEQSFGADVDYGQIVKVYMHDDLQHPERKYSAPRFASAIRRPISGEPEMESVSTSYVERLNARLLVSWRPCGGYFMTDDEKRQQKAMLLLQYEETRQELEHLRSKAWDLAQKVREISSWLEESREMSASNAEYRQRERDAKISSNLDEYKAAFEFDTVCVLREELKSTNAKLRELAAQKKALGLGS